MLGAAMSDLGEYLHREISQRGLSLRKAAACAGLSYGTLYHVLNGTGVPELPTLKKIAKGLELPLARLQELAGFGTESEEPGTDPLYGLTEDQRTFLRNLSPDRKREVIDSIRRMLGV